MSKGSKQIINFVGEQQNWIDHIERENHWNGFTWGSYFYFFNYLIIYYFKNEKHRKKNTKKTSVLY